LNSLGVNRGRAIIASLHLKKENRRWHF